MKKIFLSLILLGLGFHCSSSGKIIVKNDDFHNSKIVTMEMDHDPVGDEHRVSRFIYVAEYKNSTFVKGEIFYEIWLRKRDSALKQEVVYHIDDNEFKFTIGDQELSSKTRVSGHTNQVTGDTRVSASTRRKAKGSALINSDFLSALKGAKSIKFRLYLGPTALTFNLPENELVKVRKFASTSG